MNHSNETSRNRHHPRDDVEFLANSWNRLDVLDAVADAPRTRAELRDRTDVSRVTVSRILSDLEQRGWIARDAGRFEATAEGALVASEVARLLDTVAMVDELGSAVEWLPTEQFDFDLRHLRNASIITPGQEDLTAPTRKLVDLAHQCTHIRAIPTGITHEFIAALRDATVAGDLSLECLLPPTVFDIVSDDPELRRQFLDMVDSGNAELYRYRGTDPVIMLGIFDEQVMVCGRHDEGVPPGTMETTDDVVRRWAESYFDDRCAEARQLGPGVFTV